MQFKKQVQKEIQDLEQMKQRIEKFLEQAPEGCLKWQYKNGKIYYYRQYLENNSHSWKRKYIKKKNLDMARALAQKHYYLLARPIIDKQLKQLSRFQAEDSKNLEDIYESLSEERKSLVFPLQVSVKQKIKLWKEEIYEINTKYSENLRYDTEQGEKVRSKSEVIIANLLYQNRKKLLYKYERPLQLIVDGKMKIIHPDFTIINVMTGKIVYWEHAGRMDDPYYANDFVRKMNTYVNNGLMLGRDVIVTYETQNSPLDISVIKQTIKELL